ncbi:MAG: hypothetical protein ACO3D0_13590, partial [Ilumatobacteraceae bacterium]
GGVVSLCPLRALAAVVGASCRVVSCGGSDAVEGGPAGSETSTPGSDPTILESGTTGEPTGPVSSDPSTEPAPVPQFGEPVIAGVDPIGLLTPPSGGGDRPVLSWEPIPGAAEYLVVVHDADGAPYWSTITTATEVPVGGVVLDPGASGPRLAAGYSWVVVASDTDGVVVAASARLPIAP